jgi:hypothetical protein
VVSRSEYKKHAEKVLMSTRFCEFTKKSHIRHMILSPMNRKNGKQWLCDSLPDLGWVQRTRSHGRSQVMTPKLSTSSHQRSALHENSQGNHTMAFLPALHIGIRSTRIRGATLTSPAGTNIVKNLGSWLSMSDPQKFSICLHKHF